MAGLAIPLTNTASTAAERARSGYLQLWQSLPMLPLRPTHTVLRLALARATGSAWPLVAADCSSARHAASRPPRSVMRC